MRRKPVSWIALAAVLFCVAPVLPQQLKENTFVVIGTSGDSAVIPDSLGSSTMTLEKRVFGTATTLTLTVSGCGNSGLNCTVLATSTSTASEVLAPISTQYDKIIVKAVWTGAVSAVRINKTGFAAKLGAPVATPSSGDATTFNGGAAPASQKFVGTNASRQFVAAPDTTVADNILTGTLDQARLPSPISRSITFTGDLFSGGAYHATGGTNCFQFDVQGDGLNLGCATSGTQIHIGVDGTMSGGRSNFTGLGWNSTTASRVAATPLQIITQLGNGTAPVNQGFGYWNGTSLITSTDVLQYTGTFLYVNKPLILNGRTIRSGNSPEFYFTDSTASGVANAHNVREVYLPTGEFQLQYSNDSLNTHNTFFSCKQSTTNPGTTDYCLSSKPILFPMGATIASAATISPTSALHHVTGTATISTMNLLAGMSTTSTTCVSLIADAAWTITAGTGLGQFKNALTPTIGQRYQFCNDGTLWY